MEKITYKNILQILRSRTVLTVAGGLLLMSCTTQMGGYSETDGVYYDPNRDTIPEGTMMRAGNQVGDYYDYQASDDTNVYLNSENRNESWRETQSSDWGTYQGTDTYYTDNWGSPFGYYGGFGFGMSFGWGSPWSYGGYYSPWGFGYNPWFNYYSPYYGYYSPYYSYNPYGYYAPYYGGWGNSYRGGFTYKRSGTDGAFRNTLRNTNNSRISNNQNAGFRSDGTRVNNSNNNGFRQQNSTQPRFRNTQPAAPRQSTRPNNTPTYEPRTRNYDNGGGFRSGSSGGGFNGSSSSGAGSTRSSGGFRR